MRSRSRWLAVAVALLLATAGAMATANDDRANDPLPGTWWMKIDFMGAPLLTYLQQFHKDGRSSIILASGARTNPPLAPDEPPWNDSRSACVGDWRNAGHRTYDVTLYCLWSDQDYGMAPERIRAKLTLDKKGQHLTGPFVYESLEAGQWVGGDGLMNAKRLDVVPYTVPYQP